MSRALPRTPRLPVPGTPFTDGFDTGYAHGYDIGHAHGYAQAEADMEAAWAKAADYVRRTAGSPTWEELQRLRGVPESMLNTGARTTGGAR